MAISGPSQDFPPAAKNNGFVPFRHKLLNSLPAGSRLRRKPGRASPVDQTGASYGLNVVDLPQYSKTELQSGTTFERVSLYNQGQDIGFQDASGTLAPRQSPFYQRAVFGQTVNQSQRTTKTARHFG